MFGFLISVVGNMIGGLVVMFIPAVIYFSIKEVVRQILHRKGYRVYTKQELINRKLVPEVKDGVVTVEAVQVVDKDNVIDITPENTKSLEDICDEIEDSLEEFRFIATKPRKKRRKY